METDVNQTDPCEYVPPPMTNFRFWLVTVFGSIISVVSIVNNVLLFYLFASNRRHRRNHNMYLMLLAFFDIFVSAAYILLMSVNVLSDYLMSPSLVKLWFVYMVPMITISHIAMTSSSFLIVAASFERYCLTCNSTYLKFAQTNRKLIAAVAVFLGVISKGTMCLEFELFVMDECKGMMTEIQMGYRPFVFDTPYHTVWRFWYRNFVTIFAPFFILSYFNMRIVKALTIHTQFTVCQLAGNAIIEHAKRKSSAFIDMDPVRRKATARAATRTMVMVVCCYLISNIINVILTIWEQLDKQSLSGDYLDIYAIAVDIVSLLTTLACACRLPIYMTCQSTIREEVYDILRSLCDPQHSRSKKLHEGDYLVSDNQSDTKESHLASSSLCSPMRVDDYLNMSAFETKL